MGSEVYEDPGSGPWREDAVLNVLGEVDRERMFGARIKSLRQARGWTQEELARRLGVAGQPMHQTMVAKIESGTRPTNVGEVAALAEIFGLPVASLFEVSGDDQLQLDLVSLYQRMHAIKVEEGELRVRLVLLRADRENLESRYRDLEREFHARRLATDKKQGEQSG